MLLLRVSIPFFFLMSTDSFSVHPNPKRNEISWDEANKDLSLDTTTSMLGFNGNDSFAEVRTFERSRDAKSHQLARLSEMGEIGQMRVYNVGVLMASHLGKCGCGAVGSKTDDLAIACRFPFDLERCGPAVDLALDQINKVFLRPHNITLLKKKAR